MQKSIRETLSGIINIEDFEKMPLFDKDLLIKILDPQTPESIRKKLKNRVKWKHGFSQCQICRAKLMVYLEAGHSFDDTVQILAEKHTDIENIRVYARNVIRQSTGGGRFDDYILRRGLWTLREPVLMPLEFQDELKNYWINWLKWVAI